MSNLPRRGFLAAVLGALAWPWVPKEKPIRFIYSYTPMKERVQLFGPQVYFRTNKFGHLLFAQDGKIIGHRTLEKGGGFHDHTT